MAEANEPKEKPCEEPEGRVRAVTESVKIEHLSLHGENDEEKHGGRGARADRFLPRPEKKKIEVLLLAAGNAPILRRKKWIVDQEKKIGGVIEFLRKYLKLQENESLFLYVNQAFAPSPDRTIRSLFESFGADGKLVLHYCKGQAWG